MELENSTHKKKKLGYYEIENIGNPCILTMAVNPKEYLEILMDRFLNEKQKGIKKGSSGLGFENFHKSLNHLLISIPLSHRLLILKKC